MANSTMRKDLVFPVAGHFMFSPYSENGMPDMRRAYCSQRGIVTSISRDNSLNTVDLPDGNSPYPAATYVQTQTGTVTFNLSTYDPELEALIAGAVYKNGDAENKEMWTLEAVTLEDGVTHVLGNGTVVPLGGDGKMLVEDIYGNKLTAAEDASSVDDGKYHYDSTTKTITFSASKLHSTMFVTYAYNGEGVTAVEYQETPKITSFMAIIIGETMDKDQSSYQRVNVVIDRCGVSGSITPPTASNDPTQGWTLTTNILKPRAGHSPIIVKFENATADGPTPRSIG